MDSLPGGSGFSFVDMLANRAGILFAVAATQDASTARDTQSRLRKGVIIADFLPDFQGLPEGITNEQFHSEFGGLGGEGTRALDEETRR